MYLESPRGVFNCLFVFWTIISVFLQNKRFFLQKKGAGMCKPRTCPIRTQKDAFGRKKTPFGRPKSALRTRVAKNKWAGFSKKGAALQDKAHLISGGFSERAFKKGRWRLQVYTNNIYLCHDLFVKLPISICRPMSCMMPPLVLGPCPRVSLGKPSLETLAASLHLEHGEISLQCLEMNRTWVLHPGKLTWNLQITHLERNMIFQTFIFGFHVNLQGFYQQFVGCELAVPL